MGCGFSDMGNGIYIIEADWDSNFLDKIPKETEIPFYGLVLDPPFGTERLADGWSCLVKPINHRPNNTKAYMRFIFRDRFPRELLIGEKKRCAKVEE